MASTPSNGRRPSSLPRRSRRVVAGTAVVLSSYLLAGCGASKTAGSGPGGDSARASTAAPVNLPADQPQKAACGLVTQAEVESAIGAKVGAGKEQVQSGRSLCGFTLVSAADQSVLVVSTSSSGVPAAFDAARANAESPRSVDAGDGAFVSGAQALVRKGNTMVAVLVAVRQPPAQLVGAATKLVQALGARL